MNLSRGEAQRKDFIVHSYSENEPPCEQLNIEQLNPDSLGTLTTSLYIPIPYMNCFVSNQVRFLIESFLTNITAVGFLSCMYSKVSGKIGLLVESLATFCTPVSIELSCGSQQHICKIV